ncbi:hypothetical protein QQP08_008570 [Theobroma cacao]|nr:hypothetical protein QQP08_008570 [Theobroma cacao]
MSQEELKDPNWPAPISSFSGIPNNDIKYFLKKKKEILWYLLRQNKWSCQSLSAFTVGGYLFVVLAQPLASLLFYLSVDVVIGTKRDLTCPAMMLVWPSAVCATWVELKKFSVGYRVYPLLNLVPTTFSWPICAVHLAIRGNKSYQANLWEWLDVWKLGANQLAKQHILRILSISRCCAWEAHLLVNPNPSIADWLGRQHHGKLISGIKEFDSSSLLVYVDGVPPSIYWMAAAVCVQSQGCLGVKFHSLGACKGDGCCEACTSLAF